MGIKLVIRDGGDGCTIVLMYLMSLNCTLKMVKMVNLHYMYFITIFKNKINDCERNICFTCIEFLLP